MVDWNALGDKLSGLGESVGKSLKSVFGSRNERMVKDLEPLIAEINSFESWAQGLSSEDMKAQTAAWKEAIGKGEVELEDVLTRAFAMVREASVRTLGLRHYDVQLVGGIVLHQGSIAEMMTGEGKTLVATLPLYLNALTGKAVYLVTVNDYLARRDADWMRPIFEYLGLSVGAIQSQMPAEERQAIYDGDIVYGTNNEFGFDYLRDNMKPTVEQQVPEGPLSYAIIDEIDSILIDEARTPLIISGPAEYMPDKYPAADRVARSSKRDEAHFEVKEKENSACSPARGRHRAHAQEILVWSSPSTRTATPTGRTTSRTPCKAHFLYENDRELRGRERRGCDRRRVHRSQDDGAALVGRPAPGGRDQGEGSQIKPENQTLATITFQNYFRLYGKLAGMTGTAITEAGEFHKIYGLDVVSIPTNVAVNARMDRVDVGVPHRAREVEGHRRRDRRRLQREGPTRAGGYDQRRELREARRDAQEGAASPTRCSTPRSGPASSARRTSSPWRARRAR